MTPRRWRSRIPLFLLAWLALPAQAAPPLPTPTLLRDIRPEAAEALGHVGSEMGSAGGLVYFEHAPAFDTSHFDMVDNEVWRSDGTPEGTFRLADIYPGRTGSSPQHFVTLGSQMLFLARDDWGEGLWKSDGTPAGTVLVRHGPPRQFIDPSGNFPSAELSGTLYFNARLDEAGAELWRSDGTPEGTRRVKDLTPGPADTSLFMLTPAGSTLFFITGEREGPHTLWKSDGTEAGTLEVWEGAPEGPPVEIRQLVAAGSTLFMVTRSNGKEQLWRSDGTAAGTLQLLESSWMMSAGIAFGERLIIHAEGGLWRSDGTSAGTVLISSTVYGVREMRAMGGAVLVLSDSGLHRTDGTPEGTSRLASNTCFPDRLAEVNGRLFFTGRNSGGSREQELWTSDGTASGTVRLAVLGVRSLRAPERSPLVGLGGQLFFLYERGDGGLELWGSDGTLAGTRRVYTLSEPGSTLRHGSLFSVRDRLFFDVRPSDASSSRPQLWVSDGTAEGTAPLRRRAAPLGSGAAPMEQVGNTLLFSVEDARGLELWRSEGTEASTTRARVIRSTAPTESARGFVAAPHARLGEQVFFFADDGVHGHELWKSDGTEAGTQLVKDIRSGPESGFQEYVWLAETDRALFFVVDDGVHGFELWKSDGTEAGTQLVKDILSGPESGSGFEYQAATVGGTVFFFADDGTHGLELWKSDGTGSGTVLVKDIRAGAQPGIGLPLITAVGGEVFLFADDGVHGVELWKSDGTEAGTVLVADLTPGAPDSSVDYLPAAANGAFYFTTREATGGTVVWKSDGTGAGTRALRTLQAGASDAESLNTFFTALGSQVFFVGYEAEHGYELWKTDGTPEGTVRVRELRPGPASGVLGPLLALEDVGLLLFFGTDGVHGLEPWVTDGTAGGTSLLADLAPGPDSSVFGFLRRFGDRVVLLADDGVHGLEPWSFVVPDALAPTLTCPQDVRAQATEDSGVEVTYPPAQASDDRGEVSLTYSQASGTRFPVGTTAVSVTATDAAGNSRQCAFEVHVQAPAVQPPTAQGCACRTAGSSGTLASWGLVLMLALLRPRRRIPR
ncbi:MAG TPA: ELWxxDGT repeat protein [Archangium sp.]|uniref:ELWxxDGT repeat protein n=1 Tax=Archangium sp. TaxID=1872627 RepID=UPI002E344680|nr:ELWxxDGT repeat protein [Archangium sp.]HEX5749808.1 ELWxxDGT repeat protein [Archangium sp.]